MDDIRDPYVRRQRMLSRLQTGVVAAAAVIVLLVLGLPAAAQNSELLDLGLEMQDRERERRGEPRSPTYDFYRRLREREEVRSRLWQRDAPIRIQRFGDQTIIRKGREQIICSDYGWTTTCN